MCLCNKDLKQHKMIDQLSDWELVLVMNPANQQRGPEIIKFINNFDLFDAKLS